MTQHTCLHCGAPSRAYAMSGKGRRWCHQCLPAYNPADKIEYARRAAKLAYFARTGIHVCCGQHAPRPPRKLNTCATCGTETTRPKYCQDQCNPKNNRPHNERATRIERTCYACLQPFDTTDGQWNQTTCSRPCAAELKHTLRKWNAPDRCHIPICLDCKQPYAWKWALATRCDECHTAWTIAKNNRRRGVVMTGDRITHGALIRRDQCCHLCGLRVQPSKRHPHPRSATIDHLIPLSAGGTHTWDNVALAHLECNIKRSDTGPAQLRLLG